MCSDSGLRQAREARAVQNNQGECIEHGRLRMQVDQAVERMLEQKAAVEELHLAPVEHHGHSKRAEHALVRGVDRECSP